MSDTRHRNPDESEGRAIGFALGAAMLLLGAAFVGLILMLTGCGSTRYVPVETVKTEYLEIDTAAVLGRLRQLIESTKQREIQSDSLVDRQKETVVLKENGDTARHDTERIIYRATAHEKELEHKVTEQDSIINDLRTQLSSVKADSVQVPYPVERALSRWERVKMDVGGVAIGIAGAALCIAVWWLVRRFKR